MQNLEKFKNKKVLITGHTGFKGSWLLVWLNQLGAHIRGLALAPLNSNDLYSKIGGDLLCESVIQDIRSYEKVKEEILNFEPDYIFHLAAQPLVFESYKNPLYNHEVNILGTANILESLRRLNKLCVVVIITTDKVYYNYEDGRAYKEDDKLGGYDPYSASKAAAELVVDSYRSSFFNPLKFNEHQKSIAVARSGNVIGGGDFSENRLIPDVVKSLENEQIIEVRNPNSVRPWQHVLEALWGYLVLAANQTEHPQTISNAFNFGPDVKEQLTVLDVVKKSIEVWGHGNYITKNHKLMHEASLLQLDSSRANLELGFRPTYNAHKAIEKTILWYKYANNNYLEFTKEQINEYINTI